MPRKNIRDLGGKPLLAHTVIEALKSALITDLVLSTDDPEIRRIGLEYGAQAPFLRPPELATDSALAIPTVQHAVKEMEEQHGVTYDYIAMLQPTTPFRTAQDLDEALGRLIASEADGIISVVHVGNWHPMKMKRLVGERLADYAPPEVENPPRQSLPPVYMVNGALYATRRDTFMNRNTFQGDICLGHVMPDERSVNIDVETDFVVAEYMLSKQNEGE